MPRRRLLDLAGIATLGPCASRGSAPSAQCAICERTLLMGERTRALLAERRRQVRRRLPALPGDRARVRLGEGGLADARRRSSRTAGAAASRSPRSSAPGRPPRRRSRASRSCAVSRSPSSRSSRRPTTSTRPSSAAPSAGSRRASARPHLDHPALRRQPGDRDHGRLGDLLVPVPGHPGRGAACSPCRARATSSRSSRARSRSGTRTWSRTAESSPTSHGL